MVPASNAITTYHLPRTAEVISLKLSNNRLIYFTRLRGGDIEFALAEHKRPFLKGNQAFEYPISQYHYSRMTVGEITLEKDLEVDPATRRAPELTSLSNVLAEAYMAGQTVIVYRKAFFRGNRQGATTPYAHTPIYSIAYHGHILHTHLDDAQLDRESEVVRLVVAVQPELVEVDGVRINLQL